MSAPTRSLRVRRLGMAEYAATYAAMRAFTAARTSTTEDELWLLEHPPVFTLGLNGKPEHLLSPGAIPVITVDRGGQVTYHGPGQVVAYSLLDLRRLNLGVRALVSAMERAVLSLLAARGVTGHLRAHAPGVYVEGAKIAALGLRVKQGACYHGLALNVDMDLAPFASINPCGYAGLRVTQTRDLGIPQDTHTLAGELAGALARELGYTLRPAPTAREARCGDCPTERVR
ncbi:MAG: lipoyl(octanoyl) transferase LipB [Betaproteobacteria bacterium]|nr:lipoyl(octanoyl) transferase LipB [Betaproteobacteria bacterium]